MLACALEVGQAALVHKAVADSALRAPALHLQATKSRLSTYPNHSLCTLLHSCALLGFVPLDAEDTEWLLAIQKRLCAAAKLHKTPPRVISNTLHSLGKLQLQPQARHEPLVPALLSVSLARMPDFMPQSLANMAWALARLGARPGASWMAMFAQHCYARMHMFNAQELSNTVRDEVLRNCFVHIRPPPC